MERCETLQKRWVRGGRVGRRAKIRDFSAQDLPPLLEDRQRLKAVCQHKPGVQRSLNPIYFHHSQCDSWGKVCAASPATSMCSENGSGFKSPATKQQSTATVAILAEPQTKR